MSKLSVVGWICLSLASALLLAGSCAPTYKGIIDAGSIRIDEGASYVASITRPKSPIYRVLGDRVGRDTFSSLVLLENGLPLGPAHSKHDHIRALGAGAYSHWEGGIYFSSSDSSDPRTNGRTYTYQVRGNLVPALVAIGLLAGLLGAFLVIRSQRGRIAPASVEPHPKGCQIAGAVLSATGLTCLVLLTVAPWTFLRDGVRLEVQNVSDARDYAYTGTIAYAPSWPWTMDASGWPILPGDAQLLEDGRDSGILAADFADVARVGGGRFIYFGGTVALSTPDGSDPRGKGRRYELRAPIVPTTSSLLVALSVFALGIAVFLGRRLVSVFDSLTQLGSVSLTAGGRRQNAWLADSTIVAGFALTTIAIVVIKWWTASSGHLGVAGYLPVSDAMGYFSCATAIGTRDTLAALDFGVEFCSRRGLYPAMLSSLLTAAAGHASVALLIQAGLIGLGCGVLFLALRNCFGWITAFVGSVITLAAAADFALGNFMTESLGLAAGLAAFALLLQSAQRATPSGLLLVSGLASMSLAQFVRPGALIALPFLFVWAIAVTREMATAPRLRLLSMALAALASGFVMQLLVVTTLGGDPALTGSNSAVVLYGLSTGTREWDQAYRDFAHLFAGGSEGVAFRQIRAVALANIQAQPEVFVGSLWAAGAAFAGSQFGNYWIGQLILTPLFWGGLLLCLIHMHRPACAVLIALVAGELLSAPLVFDAGGPRVFVSTFAARAAVAGFGAAWIMAAVTRARLPSLQGNPQADPRFDLPLRWGSFGLAGLLGLAALFPATPFHAAFRDQGLQPSGSCPESQYEVVSRPGSDLIQLTFGKRKLPLLDERLGIALDGLRRDPASRTTWWIADVPTLRSGATLVHAVQLRTDELGKVVTALAPSPLPYVGDAFLSLCLSNSGHGVKLGDLHYREIMTWHLRGTPPR